MANNYTVDSQEELVRPLVDNSLDYEDQDTAETNDNAKQSLGVDSYYTN